MLSPPIRVAIVEDDPAVRETLQRLIGDSDGFRCAQSFPSAETALHALRECDVLLLDIGLPGMAGSEAVSVFRERFPSLVILMLTVFSDRSKVFRSICNGASGYLLKSTPPTELLSAIRAAHAGGSPISPEIASQIVVFFQKTRVSPPSVALTPREKQLLQLLSQGHSYESAANQIGVSVNTVRNYVRTVYEKLQVHSKPEAVTWALRQGLIDP